LIHHGQKMSAKITRISPYLFGERLPARAQPVNGGHPLERLPRGSAAACGPAMEQVAGDDDTARHLRAARGSFAESPGWPATSPRVRPDAYGADDDGTRRTNHPRSDSYQPGHQSQYPG
jgi:hypothetical protein